MSKALEVKDLKKYYVQKKVVKQDGKKSSKQIVKAVDGVSFDLNKGEIFPESGINVIYGNNAQGKTNLLESLWLFTGGHSFRGNKDKELPRLVDGVNSPNCKLSIEFESFKRDQEAEIIIKDGKKIQLIK